MQLKEILAKKFSERSAEEHAFVKTHMSELTDVQKKQFDEDTEAADKAAKEAEEKEAADKAAAEAAAKAEAERQASEGKGKVITMSEAEAKALQDKADKGAQAFAELEGMKSDRFAEKLMFSEKNTDGRFLPKQAEAVKKFVRTLSETQRDQFATIVRESAAPKLSFQEVGDAGKTEGDVVTEVEAAVKAKMSEFKLGYSAALKKVFAENKVLAARYEAHMAGQEE